jgi:NitT/TauT family transport system substrate-binding protein
MEMLCSAAALALAPAAAWAADSQIGIGVNGDEGMAQAFYAADLGLFKKSGLEVDIMTLRNGAAITAAVASGQIAIGASNVISLAQAKERHVPISLIAAGAVYDAANETEKIVTLASGPIRVAKDLNGKVIGAPSLSSTAALATYAWLDKNGGDSSSVQFLEVPQATMGVALAQGRIAAATMEDPDLNAAGTELRDLGPAYGAVAKTYILTAWFASNDWLAKNPAAGRAVASALSQGGTWAMANRVAAAGVFEKFTKKKLAQIREEFSPVITPALLQPVFDAATRYKLLPERLVATDFIWQRNGGAK